MKILPMIVGLGCLLTMPCYAGVSVTVTGVSDYVNDGISQTDSKPALQGSFDYTHNQFYAGIWTSNLNVDSDADLKREIDYYVGWTDSLNDHVKYDLTAIYYQYPGTEEDLHYNYAEYTAKLAYDQTWAKLGYEPNYGGNIGDAWFARIGQDYALNDTDTLKGEVGYHKALESKGSTAFFNEDNYAYWKVGVSRSVMGLDVNVSYIDTNADSKNDPSNIADARVVLSVGKTFALLD